MNLKRFLILCAFALITVSAQSGDLKPAINADPTYPTKSIKKINVLGVLDMRDDKTVELDLDAIKWNMQAYLLKRNYKCKDFNSVAPSERVNPSAMLFGAIRGKPKGVKLADSLMAALMITDLTENYKTWLGKMPAEAGNPIYVLVVNAAESEKDGGMLGGNLGGGFRTHAILTGYMFDREKQSIVWIDKAEDSGMIDETKLEYGRDLSAGPKLTSWTDADGAALEQIRRIIGGTLLDSFPKKGKNFALPLEHKE